LTTDAENRAEKRAEEDIQHSMMLSLFRKQKEAKYGKKRKEESRLE